ncbi:N-formylglutamate amidohydrolase [Acidihalobacter ferrooxydans]|uniref:N-formylglutamate amidohydrolase n=1 Tax=Acidihalobacter ferrooxydans TaxID=1765967 RepID=A0A1P8UE10_9GAMM|nr:N-formylglutamate amidohydrolase [Acidihalobacter ferrooxydans]APZ42101.1 N-formylglutamate amidohydrolase [Acidihalobacter ferrooxydans]
MALLEDDEPGPVRIQREAATSPFLLTADHAGNRIPRALGDLGLDATERVRHIAWDIGIAGVTERLSALLGATAVLQTYSRLVIDCNRQPSSPSAFPEVSETTPVPGNRGLTEAQRRVRREAIFDPYHGAIAAQLDQRKVAGQRTLFVALHSFTPVFKAVARPMQVALLYDRAPRCAKRMAELLRAEDNLTVAENEPYRVSDASDYTVPVHAEGRGLDYVLIEIRQDQLADAAGQSVWAERLARLLPVVATELEDA